MRINCLKHVVSIVISISLLFATSLTSMAQETELHDVPIASSNNIQPYGGNTFDKLASGVGTGETLFGEPSFSSKFLIISIGGRCTYGNATSVTVKIKKKNWLGLYSDEIFQATVPLDGSPHNVTSNLVIPANQNIGIYVYVTAGNSSSYADVAISAASYS